MDDYLLSLCRDYISYVDFQRCGLFIGGQRAQVHDELLRLTGMTRDQDMYVWCKEQISTTKRTGKRPWRMDMHLRWFTTSRRRHTRGRWKPDRRFRWHLLEYVPSSGSGPYHEVGWMSYERCLPLWTGRNHKYRVTSFNEGYDEDDDDDE